MGLSSTMEWGSMDKKQGIKTECFAHVLNRCLYLIAFSEIWVIRMADLSISILIVHDATQRGLKYVNVYKNGKPNFYNRTILTRKFLCDIKYIVNPIY